MFLNLLSFVENFYITSSLYFPSMNKAELEKSLFEYSYMPYSNIDWRHVGDYWLKALVLETRQGIYWL